MGEKKVREKDRFDLPEGIDGIEVPIYRLVENRQRYVVYFLCLKGKVVYVGQTCHIQARIRTHRKTRGYLRKIFDSVYYIDVAGTERDVKRVEGAFIKAIMPKHNRDQRLIYPWDAEALTQYGAKHLITSKMAEVCGPKTT